MSDHRFVTATARFGSVLVLMLGLAVAGCGNGPAATVAVPSPTGTPPAYPGQTVTAVSPVEAAYYFLQAMGNGDEPLMNTYLVLERRTGALSEPPPADEFQNLHCSPTTDHANTATAVVVACEFDVREDWSGIAAGHVAWAVSLQRQPPGPWLIDNYGAG
jgi:hypothetical protein